MNRQKKIASVLAGVSFIALSVAVSPAMAAGTTKGPGTFSSGNWVLSAQSLGNDFVVFNGFDVTNGDVVINEAVGGGTGTENHNGVLIDNLSTISGNLINDTVVTANYTTVSSNPGLLYSDAAGILVDHGAQVGGQIINNDTVGAFARAHSYNTSDSAQALAVGIATRYDENPDILNNGDVSASAFATAYNSAFATALGIGQETISETATADVYNDGGVSVLASAHSIDGGTDASATALALAAGDLQVAFGLSASASLTNTSNGSISVVAEAYATGINNQTAAAVALGAGQLVIGETTASATNDGTKRERKRRRPNIGALSLADGALCRSREGDDARYPKGFEYLNNFPGGHSAHVDDGLDVELTVDQGEHEALAMVEGRRLEPRAREGTERDPTQGLGVVEEALRRAPGAPNGGRRRVDLGLDEPRDGARDRHGRQRRRRARVALDVVRGDDRVLLVRVVVYSDLRGHATGRGACLPRERVALVVGLRSAHRGQG